MKSIENDDTVETQPPEVSEAKARLIIGILGLLGSFIYLFYTNDYNAGSLSRPGPGLFPLAVGGFGVIASAVVIIEALLPRSRGRRVQLPVKVDRKRAGLLFAALVAFIITLPLLGQYIASSLFAIFAIHVLGKRRWYFSVVSGLLVGFILSWIFVSVFAIPLPTALWN